MSYVLTPGARFRKSLQMEHPLQILGVPNAFTAIMAEKEGYRALYLSGAGVANYCFGLPDLGITSMEDVLTEARRILGATDLPLLVDVDTGWSDPALTVQKFEAAGVAAIQIEDQITQKKCGHLDGKELVSTEEMIERIQAAVQAKRDPEFVIMARTDAKGDDAIERAKQYEKAGADMLFAEALETLEEYKKFTSQMSVPVLANNTEFGKTPLFNTREFGAAGIQMVLYPLSCMRAMNLAALETMKTIKEKSSQKQIIEKMQTRKELYEYLDYEEFEKAIEETL